MDLLNTWQFNLLGYIIFSVLFNQFYKFAVRHVDNDGATTIALQTVAGMSALLLMPLFTIQFPTDWKIYVLLTIACIFYALNDRAQTTIRKNIEVSVYTIINQLTSVFLIVYGLTIFREPFVLGKILGGILILLANIILRYSNGKFQFNKYIVFAALANLALATALSIDIGISSQFNLPLYIMFTLIVPMLMIKVFEKIPFKNAVIEFNKNKNYFILTSLCWALLIFFMLRAYRFGSVTLITPLAATSVLINVLIATLFFGERKNIIKKIIAAVITILGVYVTVLN
jgi:drug/metabolite transporter (DMT)-like permease